MRGYFGIGIENHKTVSNLGTLWRSANIFNAGFIFTIARRYEKQCSDTLKTDRHIPLYNYKNLSAFYDHLPYNCQLVGVELVESSVSLTGFKHPERAIYLLGAEDHGLSKQALGMCHKVVQIPTAKELCLNVAVAGSLVMYDRFQKA
jgi:tRNA (guanosine-2'-O-)-methyltransferase